MRRRESLMDSNYSFETRPEQFSIEEQPLPSYEYDRDCLIPRLKVFAKKFHIEMPRKRFHLKGFLNQIQSRGHGPGCPMILCIYYRPLYTRFLNTCLFLGEATLNMFE